MESARWVPFDKVVDVAAAAVQRPKREIRDFLKELAETKGLPSCVSVERPGEGRQIVAQTLRGTRAYQDIAAVSGLLDRDELWPLLETEFGPLGSGEQSSGASLSEASAGGGDGGARTQSTGKAESNCRKWLVDLIKQSPERATMTNSALKAVAKKKFPGLGDRAFARAKKDAISRN